MLRPNTKQTPYQLWKGRKPNVSYFHPFGCVVYIQNDREALHKFDAKSDEKLFMGYTSNSRAYRMYNNHTMKMMKSTNVLFDDKILPSTDDEMLNAIPRTNVSNQDDQLSTSQHSSATFDDHLEFVDFGRNVITKMLEYVDGVVMESLILPYPALITKLPKSTKYSQEMMNF